MWCTCQVDVMLLYYWLLFLLSLPSRGQLSFLFCFIIFFKKKMGNVGVFPWRVAMMVRASRAKGAVVLPFPSPSPQPRSGTKTSQIESKRF